MIVLHSFWEISGQLHLWAESSALPAHTRGRRGSGTAKPRPHPFVLTCKAIEEAISIFEVDIPCRDSTSSLLTINLPSTEKGPLPSPELVPDGETKDKNKITLHPWEIHTLALDPDEALDFLLSLPGRPPHGTVFGSSLRFWSEVAKFTLELLTRQCFVPALNEETESNGLYIQAVWEAVINDQDAGRLQSLLKAMPPACRSVALPKGRKTVLPSELVISFINQTSDAFIRENLASKPLMPLRRGHQTPAKKWVRALSSNEDLLIASSAEFSLFTEDVKTWLDQIRQAPSDTPFRTCFRMDSPDDDEEGWRVSFHLQARDDPSLLIPAEKVWRTRSGVVTLLKRRFENPQERLLADLGKASRLFPAIERSLDMACPVAVTLDAEGAYNFLRQSAPLLEQSGFGILVPPWWQKPAARLSTRLILKPKKKGKAGSGLLGMDGLVAYDWKVALGDQVLSAREFEKLADLKVPLVKVRGQWVELQSDEIEAALTFFRKEHGNGEMRLGEALMTGLGRENSEIGLPVVDVEAQGWIRDFLDKLGNFAQIEEVTVPSTFKGQLRPYQIKGLSWLAFLREFGLGACLADDMGLGKTIEFIALMLHERSVCGRRSRLAPTLLLCPMSVVGNWQKEIERFAPDLKVMVHHGPERLSGQAFIKEARQHDIIISTYTLAHRDRKLLSRIKWNRIALDEAQNIKNPDAKQTRAIKSLNGDHRVALTGTPVENQLSELWSIMDFLNPGYLKSASDFNARFAVPIEKYRNTDKAETLKRLIQPFVLRRLKTDTNIINDLPEKMEMKVFCNLTREQATLYQAVVKDMLEKIENSEGIERKGLVLATLSKLKQVCNHPVHFTKDGSKLAGRSGKLTRLEEMLDELLAGGDKALIFTQFAEMGTMMQDHLRNTLYREVMFLHGRTPKRQREAMIERFQAGHGVPSLFILSLKAGGVGLNLTAASHVFHFDRWWNPAVENQATDRAFRIGQKKNVQVHKFVCLGTLEERIDRMIEEKKQLAESIVGTGEGWLTEMSTDQLRQVFELSREAVLEG